MMFDDLKKSIHDENNQNAQEFEREAAHAAECERQAQSYKEMLTSVLTKFLSIAFPNSSLHDHGLMHARGKYYYAWKVEHNRYQLTDIEVNLEFKQSAIPSHFVCRAMLPGFSLGYLSKKSALNAARLEKALTSLYFHGKKNGLW